MAFEEINPNNWNYENDGDNITGVLVKVEDNVGVNKSMLYTIETEAGHFVTVWGSAILDQRMKLVNVGEKLRVTYKGLTEKKPGKNAAKVFKVEVDRS
jgi:hypothetical protein